MSPVPVKTLEALARRGARQPRPGTLGDKVLAKLRKDTAMAWRAAELARLLRTDIHTMGSVLRRLRHRGLIDRLEHHWFALEDEDIAVRQAGLWTNRLANEELGPEDPRDWPTA